MTTKRRQISLSLRFSVFERDKYTCQYCGLKPPEIVLQIDHVYPVALGGRNKIDNLLTSCRDCNIGKGARDPGLAMPSRPLTMGEQIAEAKEEARWWADCVAAAPEVKAIMWELAAKIEPEGVEYVYGDERWPHHEVRRSLVRGLVATGMAKVHSRGLMCAWLVIQFDRGREDDPDAPWR